MIEEYKPLSITVTPKLKTTIDAWQKNLRFEKLKRKGLPKSFKYCPWRMRVFRLAPVGEVRLHGSEQRRFQQVLIVPLGLGGVGAGEFGGEDLIVVFHLPYFG